VFIAGYQLLDTAGREKKQPKKQLLKTKAQIRKGFVPLLLR